MRFMTFVEGRGPPVPDPDALYRWSIERPGDFWEALWAFADVAGDRGDGPALEHADRMPGARWFPGAKLNFAENLLRGPDGEPAIVFRNERGDRRELSWQALRSEVARVADGLARDDVGPGDVVAAFLPNLPETVIAMLATASRGATFTSCSPDFGIHGVLDRFGQVKPKVLFTADGYFYAGKMVDSLAPIVGVLRELASVERVVLVPYVQAPGAGLDLPNAVPFSRYGEAGAAPRFERLPFEHPLYVLYSSGTTGVPKCIVHGAGGTLLQHLKEHRLQSDVRPGDRVFYFTTCGWMMWNWLVSALASEATLLLFDGSPFHPDPSVLFDYAERERMTLFGTSTKYIDACKKEGLRPRDTHDLSTVRLMTSTGSPLAAESFDYVYEAVKPDI